MLRWMAGCTALVTGFVLWREIVSPVPLGALIFEALLFAFVLTALDSFRREPTVLGLLVREVQRGWGDQARFSTGVSLIVCLAGMVVTAVQA